MATAKDVAKLAGVSLGSVSNVINGRTHNHDLIERVEKAMKTLSYRPDANARSLKAAKSSIIGIVLPDTIQPNHVKFLDRIEKLLRTNGYDILLKLSHNNKFIEKKSIENLYSHGVDGIILYSVIEKNDDFYDKSTNVPVLLIARHSLASFNGDQIIINYLPAFEKSVKKYRAQDLNKTYLIIEKDLLQSEKYCDVFTKYYSDASLIKAVDSNKESGFQAFFQIYSKNPDIEAVIAGSYLIAQGIKKAQDILGIQDLNITVIKESSWIEDENYFDAQISIPHDKVASIAVKTILKSIDRPTIHTPRKIYIDASYETLDSVISGIEHGTGHLRFAMMDNTTANSLKMIAKIYEDRSNIKIDFDILPYNDLKRTIFEHAHSKDSKYDGFMLDVPWLECIVNTGYVKKLDTIAAQTPDFFQGFSKEILTNYATVNNSIYAVPFVSGSNVLIYQKDLFEDEALKIKFRRKYNEELQPPKTWPHFNLIAEFFTQSANHDSPTKYGVSMARGINIFSSINFMMYLWSYGGLVFDSQGRPAIKSTNSIAALQQYIRSIRCSSGQINNSWIKVVDEFKQGNSAMVIVYDSDAGSINNYTESNVAGNLACALIPGGTPVLGGWSLALNNYGKNKKETAKFVLWACSDKNSITLPLLGGSSLRKHYYNSSNLNNIQPWKQIVMESFHQSKKRNLPCSSCIGVYKDDAYSTIIPEEIERVISYEISESEAIDNIQSRLEEVYN